MESERVAYGTKFTLIVAAFVLSVSQSGWCAQSFLARCYSRAINALSSPSVSVQSLKRNTLVSLWMNDRREVEAYFLGTIRNETGEKYALFVEKYTNKIYKIEIDSPQSIVSIKQNGRAVGAHELDSDGVQVIEPGSQIKGNCFAFAAEHCVALQAATGARNAGTSALAENPGDLFAEAERVLYLNKTKISEQNAEFKKFLDRAQIDYGYIKSDEPNFKRSLAEHLKSGGHAEITYRYSWQAHARAVEHPKAGQHLIEEFDYASPTNQKQNIDEFHAAVAVGMLPDGRVPILDSSVGKWVIWSQKEFESVLESQDSHAFLISPKARSLDQRWIEHSYREPLEVGQEVQVHLQTGASVSQSVKGWIVSSDRFGDVSILSSDGSIKEMKIGGWGPSTKISELKKRNSVEWKSIPVHDPVFNRPHVAGKAILAKYLDPAEKTPHYFFGSVTELSLSENKRLWVLKDVAGRTSWLDPDLQAITKIYATEPSSEVMNAMKNLPMNMSHAIDEFALSESLGVDVTKPGSPLPSELLLVSGVAALDKANMKFIPLLERLKAEGIRVQVQNEQFSRAEKNEYVRIKSIDVNSEGPQIEIEEAPSHRFPEKISLSSITRLKIDPTALTRFPALFDSLKEKLELRSSSLSHP